MDWTVARSAPIRQLLTWSSIIRRLCSSALSLRSTFVAIGYPLHAPLWEIHLPARLTSTSCWICSTIAVATPSSMGTEDPA
eukprot:1311651-Amphidinium_carterae.1